MTENAIQLEGEILATRNLQPGDLNYRAYVGPPDQYDFMGATQFRLLTSLGLREEHRARMSDADLCAPENY